ncbi:helix-turn-helix transcriptional regulator [Parendozoicomonas haliclonae]|uniref:Uncharacterized protein n=1 Tax=Parendozoicomonas haliclonae TaxID=1960125 RepID=A0A1X7ARQ8_9GAMM|nr:helix-turn-helix transcriptional regulator [Parendozoicomonas haliclonae]SMA50087.1 hypothetical protein EHSB41UT_03878 [Parendozoicomonas haliclonae]
MLESFGDYLKKRRKEAGLTQDRLAVALSCYSPVLSGIDSVTISRWERATTEPTCDRQREVIAYFHDDVEKIYPFRSGRASRVTSDQAVEYLVRHYLVSPKLGQKVGTFPEKEGGHYQIERFNDSPNHQNCLDMIIEYDQSLSASAVPVSHERLGGWIRHSNRLALLCMKHGQYFGHLIALPLKDEVFWQLVHARREEASLSLDDIAAPGESHSLYIFSLYGASRLAAGRLIMEVMTYISRHFDHINYVGGLCATSDGARLARAFHLEPVEVGPISPKGQVRYQGREVKFVTYANQLAHILEDAGLRKLLPV